MRMRYFVIGEDGELYGPANVATLNEWIIQGRLSPTSMIQEEFGGARFAASLLEGLIFSQNYTPPAKPQPPGDVEFRVSWIMGILGFLCFPLFGIVGIAFAISARKKGHPHSLAAIIFCMTVTLCSLIITGFYIHFGGQEGIMEALRNYR